MSASLTELERRLGYTFHDSGLLERALTHRSWAHENLPEATEFELRGAQNEALEFVGDSVLGLAVAEYLYLRNPTLDEGGLTLMKHRLVSTGTLAKIAGELKLGEHIRFGRGEERSGGREKQALLANALEAVIGAVFFDGGYVKARHFIRGLLKNELKQASPAGSVDHKTTLQEILQARGLGTPDYKVVRTEGKPHSRTFWVEAVWANGASSGHGRSIKAAEMMAAAKAIAMLNGNTVTADKEQESTVISND